MPDYERRFIQAKTSPRKAVLNDAPIIKVEKITEKTFAFNKIIYRNYVVTRSDQKIYEFNDNDLINLNLYDLTHLYAYCSVRYDLGRREIRMSMVEFRASLKKASLSLKSVQSQSEESKCVSEVISETVSQKDIRELLIRDPNSEL
ncbi:hypothetical protein L6452_26039 [Arctium lappa]|uniref:Uncharacterized protein n=1 Tax=Arctium lappa TaxID=4217 RepID=A0ACB9AC22_ARCLA|nr:hypothetical protein L6452_26039 [Arctium lappa]